jgi:hypothetical protein
MADVPVPEWMPDQAPLGDFTRSLNNVVSETPIAYGPCKALAAVTEALAARCQGAASFRAGGVVRTFAGDVDTLYRQDPTDSTAWEDASGASGPYNTSSDDVWEFAQYGDLAIAVNGSADPVQKFDITTDTTFSDLGGSPPDAHDVAIWDDYVVLAEISPDNRIINSGTDDPESWTPGTDNCKRYPFGDGGKVVKLTGGKQKLVLQENMIRRATNVGGEEIFQINVISTQRGCAARGSVAVYQDLVFFVARDGFFLISDAGLEPIGDQKVNKTFWDDVNRSHLHRITSVCDPARTLYRISYPSLASGDGTPDRMLIYNWSTKRWTPADYAIEHLFRVITGAGITLEALNALYPGGLETIPISLDSPAFASTPEEALAAIDSAHKLGFFDGDTLAPTLPSPEGQLIKGMKAKVKRVRAIVDGGDPSAIKTKIGVRDNKLNDAQRFTAQVAQNDRGHSPFAAKRTKGRYHQVQTDIDAATDWQNFQGWDVETVQAGVR